MGRCKHHGTASARKLLRNVKFAFMVASPVLISCIYYCAEMMHMLLPDYQEIFVGRSEELGLP